MRLRDGSRVAVIGAGPSGSIAACQLLRLAGQRGIRLDVTIFDRKQFLCEGPAGCNLCAGVVCSELLQRLSAMGIVLPSDRTQRVIEGYSLELRSGQIRMDRAASHGPIVTVYRGNGPRSQTPHVEMSFDDLLLKHALKLGARFLPRRVVGFEPSAKPSGLARVVYDGDGGLDRLECDLVVVACGVNSTFLRVLEQSGTGYRRPRCRRACQIEIPIPERLIDAHFGNYIHVFALGLKRIRFAALVPKRGFVTLTLIGYGDLGPDDLRRFLHRPELLAKLPPGWTPDARWCQCFPLMPVSAARRPVADRMVVIGDAAVSRFHKNGLGSAYDTATLAAGAAMDYGVSRQALRRHFWITAKRTIDRDNLYGRVLASGADVCTRSGLLSAVYLDALLRAPADPARGTFHFLNWNMITGDRPYREIARRAASAGLAIRMIASFARLATGRLRPGRPPAKAIASVSRGNSDMGPLRDGQTVAIVGAGPAGASCAIALRHMAAQRQMNVRVLIYESKDFQEESQCNQCAGLLSPPIAEVLEERLGIPFPHDLVQRRIHDYLLIGGEETIRLAGGGKESYALRRIQFDRYLLRQAILSGAEWVRSKVRDVQIDSAGVRIDSDDGSRTADAIVGAFGLDETTARAFRRTTGYAAPPCIQTLVTKLHPPPEQMAGYGQTVYTFLPPIRNVEFAAVIPKGNHLTIVQAGKKLTDRAMDQLLAWRPLQEIVPVGQCRERPPTYYRGSFPTALGRRIYGDRYVMVGDSSGLVRPFKGKGVTTACVTGHLAAKTMMDRGISRQALEGFQRQCRELVEDIFFGRLVRLMVGAVRGSGTVDEMIRQARRDEGIRNAMYCCVSGEGAYKTMLAGTVSLGRAARVGKTVLGSLLSLPFRQR